jgi:hypothetical protein
VEHIDADRIGINIDLDDTMNRADHEQELAASNARAQSEDESLHEWRLRQFAEIAEGMKAVSTGDLTEYNYDLEPF